LNRDTDKTIPILHYSAKFFPAIISSDKRCCKSFMYILVLF